MFNLVDKFWAGTEETLAEARQIEAAAAQAVRPSEAQKPELPRLLTKMGNVGVVTIRGPLTNVDNWVTDMFGMSTYPAIKRALVTAAQDPEVTQILLDIGSGGGAVAGVEDTGNMISRINKQVKPVTTFSSGMMASAAMWLGASAGKVHAEKTGIVGSVGVITTHYEESKALDEAGIKATVIRAGKYKALASSVEPLSDTAREQIQSQLDGLYTIFADHMADARGVTVGVFEKTMGQGREFLAQDGVDVGLIDSVSTFDEVLSALQASKPVDNKKRLFDNKNNTNGIKSDKGIPMIRENAVLTEQQIAAIAAGADLGMQVAEPTAEEIAAEAAAVVASEAAAQAAADAAVNTDVQSESEVVKFLRAELAERTEELVNTRVSVHALTEKNDQMVAMHDGLLAIARGVVNNMAIALNSGSIASDLDASAVLNEHKRLVPIFTKQFKVGGVAAVTASQEDTDGAQIDPLHAAKIAAVRINHKRK